MTSTVRTFKYWLPVNVSINNTLELSDSIVKVSNKVLSVNLNFFCSFAVVDMYFTHITVLYCASTCFIYALMFMNTICISQHAFHILFKCKGKMHFKWHILFTSHFCVMYFTWAPRSLTNSTDQRPSYWIQTKIPPSVSQVASFWKGSFHRTKTT